MYVSFMWYNACVCSVSDPYSRDYDIGNGNVLNMNVIMKTYTDNCPTAL